MIDVSRRPADRPAQLPRAIAAIDRPVRLVVDAWIAAGATGCWLHGPDGQVHLLAGDADRGDASVSASFGPPLRGWALVAAGPGVARSRLDADVAMLGLLARRSEELDQTTAALIETNDQLLALYDLSASSATSLEGRGLLQRLVDDARRLTGAGAAAIALDDGTTVTSGVGSLMDALTSSTSDDGLARAGANGNEFDVVSRRLRGDAAGALRLAAPVARRFSTPQLKLIDAVVDHVSGFLSLATMHEAALASAVIERDAHTAAALARMILPTSLPAVRGLDVAARCDPARLAAGDFYSWTETPDGLVFAVGDVSGKGLGAALVMTMVARAATRAALGPHGGDPDALMTTIAGELYGYLDEASVFVTLLVGVYRPGDDVIRLANAGHSPVVVRSGGSAMIIPASGPPLGVLEDPRTSALELPFHPGDLLVVGTDGLTEQQDTDGRQLGYDRLTDLIARSSASSADDAIGELFAVVEAFGAGAAQDDDRTALVLHRSAA